MIPCKELEQPIYNGESLKDFTFPPNFDHKKSAVPGNPCYNFRFRIFIFFTYIVITQVGVLYGTPQHNIPCSDDSGHNATAAINEFLHDHKWFRSMLQIISGLVLDFSFIFISIYWVLYIRNFRLYATLILFYGVRSIHQNLMKLHFAEGYIWDDPGVPSFVQKYGYYSDFFYSGHCGFLTICALEMRKVGRKYLSIMFLICAFYVAFIVISFRIHYTIDVPAGFIFAHYFYNMVCYWEAKIDYVLKRVVECLKCNRKKPIRIENETDIEKHPKINES